MQDDTDDTLPGEQYEPDQDRNRKGVVWLWLVLAALAVGGLSYYLTTQTGSGMKTTEASKPAPEKPDPVAQQAPETATAPASAPADKSAAATQTASSTANNSSASSGTATTSEQTVSATVSSSVPVAKPEEKKQPDQPAPTEQQAAQDPAQQPEQPAQVTTEQPKADPDPQSVQQSTTSKSIETPQAPPAQETPAQETQVASAAVPPAPAPAKPAAPTFDTVRVEPTGDALIAGRAAPGTEVTVKLNGTAIGKTTANADGAFVFVPDKPLPAGTGTLSLEAGASGQVVSSLNTVAVAVKAQAQGEALVAVVKPDEPVAVIQAPSSGTTARSDKVVLDAVEYDDTGAIVFSGRSNPGNTVRIYVDNELVGEVMADQGGKWIFNGKSAIAAGKHNLRADEVDKSGKVLSRVEIPFLREETAKVAATENQAPNPPVIGVSAGKANAAVPQRIVIQPGNNLWRLSRLVYGRGTRYTVIYEANKDQIRNPDLIYPGQVFAMPVTP